jgi:hypothetical protein
MRLASSLIALAVLAPVAALGQSTPVVLELYTSQGCSSCPPADALLTELAGREGVIALALHVDYWDYLGWRDSFARPQNTKRQRAYAKAARSRSIYTPEMVVQGEKRMKGHDAERILGEIARQQARPAEAELELSRDGDALEIRIVPRDGAEPGPADVHLVRFLPEQQVAIEDGENAGRDITYTNIVTDWQTIGHWDGLGPVELRQEGVGGDQPLAVIVQRSRMGPVVTAAELEVAGQ